MNQTTFPFEIGSGLQAKVFSINPHRVKKIQHSLVGTVCRTIASDLKHGSFVVKKSVQNGFFLHEIFRQSLQLFHERISHKDLAHCGNVVVKDIYSYEQDKSMPLGLYVQDLSEEMFVQTVDLLVETIITTWKNGYADFTFEFMNNYGIGNEHVVLLDLGELCFSNEDPYLRWFIKNKVYFFNYSFYLLRESQQRILFYKFEKYISLRELDSQWNTLK